MWTWLGTVLAGALELTNKILDRQWDGRSAEEVQYERWIVEAKEKKWAALNHLKEAEAKHDADGIVRALSAINGWDQRLRTISDEAAAKWPG